MRLSTGRWVSGDDFFDRVAELRLLESQLRDHNHVLLSGQRRMGKTSIVRELGRRLVDDGWIFLFADVEGADCPEDLVAAIAEAAHPIRSISARVAAAMQRFFAENVEEISAQEFRLKIRAGLNAGSWQHYGDQLFRECAGDKPVLLAIDELPIFLKRLHRDDGNARRVDDVLFARLRDFAVFRGRNRLTVDDVHEVYQTAFLGPAGQSDIVHYDTRLQDALEDEGYILAMEILAEAATQDVFAAEARRCLERQYAGTIEDVRERVSGVLDVLVHDGYLERGDGGYRFPLHPLKQWWAGRFRDHHVPLRDRRADHDAGEP